MGAGRNLRDALGGIASRFVRSKVWQNGVDVVDATGVRVGVWDCAVQINQLSPSPSRLCPEYTTTATNPTSKLSQPLVPPGNLHSL